MTRKTLLITLWLTIGAALPAAATALSPAPRGWLPETITLDRLAGTYEPVVFDHGLHNTYGSCVECHHHLAGRPPSNPACTACHRQGTDKGPFKCVSCHLENRYAETSPAAAGAGQRYHMDIPGLKGAYHLRCLNCHLAITAGPTGCQDCHQASQGK